MKLLKKKWVKFLAEKILLFLVMYCCLLFIFVHCLAEPLSFTERLWISFFATIFCSFVLSSDPTNPNAQVVQKFSTETETETLLTQTRENVTDFTTDTKAKKEQQKKQTTSRITLDNIAGYDSVKSSMLFLVSCMKNPQLVQKNGANLPNGILFYGPPGTGKTLFAKGIAGSANVQFYYLSASNFIEKYVGVGAQRVRTLFAEAKKHQPCIIFIDELDAVGKTRCGEMDGERQQTINQLLVELSEISANHLPIMVIGATNRLDDLDPALVRPGRFDRKIAIPYPNFQDRKAIIAMYCKNKNIESSVNLTQLAQITDGMSGANIANIINEAALQAVYHEHRFITQEDLDCAIFTTLTNGEKTEIQDAKTKRIIAYHEAGHAIAIKLLTSDSIPQVSIIGSTSGALGLTMRCSTKEDSLLSKSDLENKIKCFYAGRAAEELLFGDKQKITTGASNDIHQASSLIREYLTTYGMDSMLNMTDMGTAGDSALLQQAKTLSQSLYADTLLLLKKNWAFVEQLATKLLIQKTVIDMEITQIIKNTP